VIHVELVNGRSIEIEWRHKPLERESVCMGRVVHADSDVRSYCSAKARCHPNDGWSKEQGRRVTLTRLLNQLRTAEKFTKFERKLVWLVYFSR